MKSKFLALVLLAGGSLFAGPRVFVGVGGGYVVAPPPLAPVVSYYPKNGGWPPVLNPTSVSAIDWKEASSHPKGEMRRSWKSN